MARKRRKRPMSDRDNRPLWKQIVEQAVEGFSAFSDRVVVGGVREEFQRRARAVVTRVAETMAKAELGKNWEKLSHKEQEVWLQRASSAVGAVMKELGRVGGRK